MNTSYLNLEPSITSQLGLSNTLQSSFQTGQVVSLLASTSFLWSLGIMLCVGATVFVYIRGSIWRMEASEAGIRKSNEEFKRGTLGLLGVLSLFLLLYTLNRGMVTGNIGLDGLRSGGTFGGGGARAQSTGSGGSPKACDSTSNVISALQSQNVCGNIQCGILSGCNYQQYLPIIQSEATKQNVDPKMLIVLMCKESGAKPQAQNQNKDGTFDCGLMQINQKTPCDSSVMEVQTNIARGALLLKQKINVAVQVYQSVPPQAGIFASYNCCSNGTAPTTVSADCNQSSGFPTPIPKWACPINPGDSSSNMCAVKNYACELTSCLSQI